MELGQKLRQARLEAGLSQRQLCGEEITRNMLSQIENGTARPSMKTLGYLASRLGKSVGYFLDEDRGMSPHLQAVTQARACYDAGDFAGATRALEEWGEPDPALDREKTLLTALAYLELAAQAAAQGRVRHAEALLEKIPRELPYCAQELERRRLLLLGTLGRRVSRELPSLDDELLLRAGEALAAGDSGRTAALLEAAENHSGPRWAMLRGETYLAQEDYAHAAACFHQAEAALPRETAPRLEICYRELGDFRQAYRYAKMGGR